MQPASPTLQPGSHVFVSSLHLTLAFGGGGLYVERDHFQTSLGSVDYLHGGSTLFGGFIGAAGQQQGTGQRRK